MQNCPCCSHTLLRHINHSNIYWYCPHCHQEMPDLQGMVTNKRHSPSINDNWLERAISTSSLVRVSA